MKIDKAALREATVDTMLGAIVNFPLSWLTITIVLLFTHNLHDINKNLANLVVIYQLQLAQVEKALQVPEEVIDTPKKKLH